MDWLDKIASFAAPSRKFAGLHLQLLAEEQVQIHYVLLEKKKSLLSVLQTWELNSVEELAKVVDTRISIGLSLDGRGILTKHFSSVKEDSPIRQVLPHADEQAFDYTLLQQERQPGGIISLGRKDLMGSYLEKLKQAGFSIAQVSIGPSSIKALVPFFAFGDIEIQLLEQKVFIRGGQIKEIKAGKEEIEIELGEEKLNSRIIQPYANAVQQLLGQPQGIETSLVEIRQEWLHHNLFNKLVAGGLAFFFLILLTNFFVFQNLSFSHASLTNQLSQHKYQLVQLANLEERFQRQEKFQKMLGIGRQSLFSYYADRLGATIYKEIVLTSLLIHPMEEVKGRETFVFKADWLKVEGICNRPVILNKWIEVLEQQEWVEEISQQRYTTSWQEREGNFSFLLKIKRP